MCHMRCQLLVLLVAAGTASAQRLRITNACDREPLWVAHMAGADNGPDPQNAKVGPGEHRDFDTHDGLSSTRYWPKMRCNDQGSECQIGESGGPGQECNPTQGCAPPIDSKFEGTFGTEAGIDWIDVSLVDGWTLPFKFKMTLQGKGKCNAGDGNRTVFETLDCSTLTLDECPATEVLNSEETNLQVIHPDTDKVVGCYSPCAKLTSNNWNNHIADGVSPADDMAVRYCCPTPPESPEACRSGPVEQTKFVKAVHENCPGVYGYSYDDGMGLITCPKDTKYEMIFYCPDGNDRSKVSSAHAPAASALPPSTTSLGKELPGTSKLPDAQQLADNKDSEHSGFSKVEEEKHPKHEYCGDRHLFEGVTTGQKDCQKKCEVEGECEYYSYWTSGGTKWCRATPSCDNRKNDDVETVEIFRRRNFARPALPGAHADAALCCFDGYVEDPCGTGCLLLSEVNTGFCVPRETWCETCTDDSSCYEPSSEDIGNRDAQGEMVIMRKDAFHAIIDERRRRKSADSSFAVLMVSMAAAAILLVSALVLKLRRAIRRDETYATRGIAGSPGTAGSPMPAQARSP